MSFNLNEQYIGKSIVQMYAINNQDSAVIFFYFCLKDQEPRAL